MTVKTFAMISDRNNSRPDAYIIVSLIYATNDRYVSMSFNYESRFAVVKCENMPANSPIFGITWSES